MDKELISSRLVKLRGNKTQKAIADEVGVSVSTWAMYETGQRIPSDEVKIKIAKVFKKSVQRQAVDMVFM